MSNQIGRTIRFISFGFLIVCLSMLALPTMASAAFDPVPEDDEFAPFLCDGEPSWDPHQDDQSNHRDIVGDETRPAVLRTASDDHLYLRIRLDGDPRQNPDNLRPFGWGFLFDAPPLNFEDGDESTNTYDYLLHLNGTGSPGFLTFHSNEGQLELDDPTAEAAGDILWDKEHNDPDPIWHVQEAPGDPVGSEPSDYHLTIAIAWDDLTPHGITPDGVTVLWTGTTTSNNSIDRDFACHDAGSGSLTMSEFPTDSEPLDPDENPCNTGDATCPDNSMCIYVSGGDYSCECEEGFADDDDQCFEIVAITSPDEGDEVQTSTPTVEGTAASEADVVIYVDGDEVDTVSADEDGNWSWTAEDPIDDGEVTVNAESTSENGTTTSDSVTFTIDDGQGQPVTITSPDEGDEVQTSTPTVEGTAEPQADVVIYVDGDEVDTVSADEDGNWSWTSDDDLDDGEVTVTAESTVDDTTTSDSVTFTVDGDDGPVTITSPDEGDEVQTSTPTVEGTAEPQADVVIYVDGEEVDTVSADDNGSWSWTSDDDLDDGEVTVTAESTVDGTTTSDSVTFTVDGDGEGEPVVITTDDGSEFDDDSPTIEGTGEPGDTIVITVDGEEVDTVEVDEDGNWSWTPDEPLDDGDSTITATSDSDPDSSDSVTITVNTETTNVTIDYVIPSDSSDDDDGTVIVGGTAEPGSTIDIIVDGEVVETTTADEDGNWEAEVDLGEDGDSDLEVTATDSSGNQSSDNYEFDFGEETSLSLSGGGVACAAADTNSAPSEGALLVLVMLGLVAVKSRRSK